MRVLFSSLEIPMNDHFEDRQLMAAFTRWRSAIRPGWTFSCPASWGLPRAAA
jgi:hypothetical protein